MLEFIYCLRLAIVEKKIWRWVGFPKSYVICRVGHGKCLRLLTRWVGGVKKGQNYAYVILEWSLTRIRKYYIIFVYILQGKMGMTEKKADRKSHN